MTSISILDDHRAPAAASSPRAIHMRIWDEHNHLLVNQRVDRFPCRVGRAEDCEVQVPSDQVSKAHLQIEWTDGVGHSPALRVRDLTSRNGLFAASHEGEGEFTRVSPKVTELVGVKRVQGFLGVLRFQVQALAATEEDTRTIELAPHQVPEARGAYWRRALGVSVLGLAFVACTKFLDLEQRPASYLMQLGMNGFGAYLVALAPALLSRLHNKRWKFGILGATILLFSGLTTFLGKATELWAFNFGGGMMIEDGFPYTIVAVALVFTMLVLKMTFSKVRLWKLGATVAALCVGFGIYHALDGQLRQGHNQFKLKTFGSYHDELSIKLREFNGPRDQMDQLMLSLDDSIGEINAIAETAKEKTKSP